LGVRQRAVRHRLESCGALDRRRRCERRRRENGGIQSRRKRRGRALRGSALLKTCARRQLRISRRRLRDDASRRLWRFGFRRSGVVAFDFRACEHHVL
jgi:hypothetical protein